MSSRTFGDLSVKEKTTFLIHLAVLRLMERKWLAGDDEAKINAMLLIKKLETEDYTC